MQELRDEGLPVLEPYLGASVKVRESHERALPLVHLDAGHRLTQDYLALHAALEGARAKPAATKRRANQSSSSRVS